MLRIFTIVLNLVWLATAICAEGVDPIAVGSPLTTQLRQLSVSKLEQRLGEIENKLDSLAAYNLRNGIGSVSYRSPTYRDANNREWVGIELGRELLFDQIVLVPSIGRNSQQGIHAQCFPQVFEIVAGSGTNTGRTIASFSLEDQLLPRIAPVVIDCPNTRASWLRLEASVLSQLAFGNQYALELAEIFVFSDQDCLTLDPMVRTTTPYASETRGPWQQRFLVDGFVPYLMESATGEQSVAMVASIDIDDASFTIDLGAIHTLDEIHLHTVELSDNIPQSYPGDFGIPQRFTVQGATRSDFHDAVSLFEYYKESIFDTGPIIIRRIPETDCRFVKLAVQEPYIAGPEDPMEGARLGFAEIELLSGGTNVAKARPVSANFHTKRRMSALTDGRNFYGDIMPIRIWLNELALRHDLESERPKVIAELNLRYGKQKSQLTMMTWVAAALTVVIGFTILVERLLRTRQAAAIRERLAADLHDELGGNLHAIGLLSDHAQSSVDSPEKMKLILQRLRELTERTSDAARSCTRALSAPDPYDDLVAEMLRTSNRIMADLQHEMMFEGQEHLHKLKSRDRADLFFFYKECLVNISRHSDATEFDTHLIADRNQIHLTIRDNGRGLGGPGIVVPPSLARRAKLLGAQVSIESQMHHGTCVKLTLNVRRRLFGR